MQCTWTDHILIEKLRSATFPVNYNSSYIQTIVFQNMELKDLLPYGFAIHHAGMAKYVL